MRDAHVACRELGFSEAQDALMRNYADSSYSYEYGGWSRSQRSSADHTPIWMANVRCSGTEAKLTDCAFSGWGHETCGHYEDVALRCKGRELERTMNISITFFCVSTTFSIIAVAIAFLTLSKVWSVTRGPLLHPFTQVVEMHQSGAMPQPAPETGIPVQDARVVKHVESDCERLL